MKERRERAAGAETLLTYIPTPFARPVPPLRGPRDARAKREGELGSGARPAAIELKGAVTIFRSFEGI